MFGGTKIVMGKSNRSFANMDPISIMEFLDRISAQKRSYGSGL